MNRLIPFILFALSLVAPLKAEEALMSKPTLKVTKTETCGCCAIWVERAEMAGYPVEVHDISYSALQVLKDRLGIPMQGRSCHTVEVGGYYVEGHVPLADVDRLLAEKPEAAGLAVPGMPLGSPGMDFGPDKDPFNTYLVKADGTPSIFARHHQD